MSRNFGDTVGYNAPHGIFFGPDIYLSLIGLNPPGGNPVPLLYLDTLALLDAIVLAPNSFIPYLNLPNPVAIPLQALSLPPDPPYAPDPTDPRILPLAVPLSPI